MIKKINGKRGRKRVIRVTLKSPSEIVSRGRPRTRKFSPGVALAVEAAGGSLIHLAEVAGVSTQAVSAWQQIPVNHVRLIEKATGVPREKLRPDIFGK